VCKKRKKNKCVCNKRKKSFLEKTEEKNQWEEKIENLYISRIKREKKVYDKNYIF
jgi:hypothetical protein